MINLSQYNITPSTTEDVLLNIGFSKLGKNIYTFERNLYNKIIYLQILINMKDGEDAELDIDVIDKNTMSSYYPFYYNINGNNNLVTLEVISKFNDFMNELQKKNIIVKEEYENV